MDPQSLNSYSYARNNPVMNKDGSGEYWETAFDVAMFALSLNDFKEKPSFGHGVGVALDGASILLPIPAIYGGIKHSADAAKFIKNLDKIDEGEKMLYRTMKEGEDGLPILKESAEGLGVRTTKYKDILVDADGMVHPNTGGMSVSPNSVDNLPLYRKSEIFGGTSKSPTWCIGSCSLPEGLKFIQDSAKHGTIQPAYSMPVDNFKSLIESTKSLWKKVN